jgi:hypothetical protein
MGCRNYRIFFDLHFKKQYKFTDMTTTSNLSKNYRTGAMETVAPNGTKRTMAMTNSAVTHMLLSCSIFYISSWSVIAFALFLLKMITN